MHTDVLLRRPAALFCLIFVFSGFVGIHLSLAVRLSLLLLPAIPLLFLLLPPGKKLPNSLRKIFAILLSALLLGTAFFTGYSEVFCNSPIRKLKEREAVITGVVQSRDYALVYAAGYTVQLREVNGKPVRIRILLDTENTSLSPGDVITGSASFTEFREQSGTFAEERYYFSRGILLRAEGESVKKVSESSPGLRSIFDEFRSTLTGRLTAALGREDAALPAALFIGDRSHLPDSLTRDFRRLGISHLLAISGFHFTLLFCLLEHFLSPIFPAKKPRLLILAGLTVVYTVLAGMSESVLRAAIMMLFGYCAILFGRKSDMPTALGLSAFLICLVNPAAFYSVGLQLSVTSVLGLACFSHIRTLLLSRITHPFFSRCADLLLLFFLPIAVQILILPMLCLYFGEISLLTPAATLVFSPLIELLLLAAPLVLLLPRLPFLGSALGMLSHITEKIADTLSAPRGITLSLSYPLCPYLAIALTLGFAVLTLCKERKYFLRTIALCASVLILFCGYTVFSASANAADTRIVSMQRKDNDALIAVVNGKYLLCDISNGSYTSLNEAYAEAAKQHAVELDVLMLTHLHKRHIQSFDRMSDSVRIREVILPTAKNSSEEEIEKAICQTAQEKNIPVRRYTAGSGEAISFETMQITPGKRSYISRSTHPVITLLMENENFSLRYLGTSWNETDEVPAGTLLSDTVLFGSHGPIYKKSFALPAEAKESRILVRPDTKTDIPDALTGQAVFFGGEPLIIRQSSIEYTAPKFPETAE